MFGLETSRRHIFKQTQHPQLQNVYTHFKGVAEGKPRVRIRVRVRVRVEVRFRYYYN